MRNKCLKRKKVYHFTLVALYYGKIEKYALINTTDGKWGYVSYDGKITKLYDDATSFSNGIAAVKEGEEIYGYLKERLR